MNGKTCIIALSTALALCSTLACDDPELDDVELDDGSDQFRVASDPALESSYTACVDAGNFNGVNVVIRYPMGANCLSTVPDSPIALLLHGNTFSYTQYAYLLDHLAENGIIAVSAGLLATDNHNGHTATATTAVGVLDAMRANWAFGSEIDPTQLAVIGHSRGGMTAAYVAQQLEGGGDPWTVRAIVKLAGKTSGSWPIDGDASTGLLVLQGALDVDQEAQIGFMNYDESGTEGAADGLYKAMKLLEHGDHAHFSSKYGLDDQSHTTKGYVYAFLAAHLLGDWTWYEDYIRGDEVPWGYGWHIATQFSDGYLRKVIDNFEDQQFATATVAGGTVSKPLSTTVSVLDLSNDLDIQGETWALKASGYYAGDYVQWLFPAFNGGIYKWLSLRIGQVDGAASSSVSIQIRNNNMWQTPVLLSAHGAIEQPMQMCPKGSFSCSYGNWDTEAHMGTIRVPIAALGDTNAIDGVRLVFTSKATQRTYVIDSLEFAGFGWAP